LDVEDAALQAACAEATGPIDALVCNAGLYPDRDVPFESLSPQMLRDAFGANVTGVAMTVQAQLRNMSEGGRIAVVASAMGRAARASGTSFAYRASKAAAINLALNLAAHLKPRGIAVQVWHPGWVRTDMGGPRADLDAATSARHLWDRLAALDLAATGRFLNHDGTPLTP
jgi:NAD(P)-dependent dehydrogenase (short-subunit alcohol dehydrogenase family)